MTRTIVLLISVFVGGAIPWLEAVIVIPAGILAGLHPVPAVAAGVTGNLLTVALAAWFGDRLRRWWTERRSRTATRTQAGEGSLAERPASTPDEVRAPDGAQAPDENEAVSHGRQWRRVERVARRWGLPALAILGPIGLGTQVSVIVAVGIGVETRRAFWWIAAGTVLWSLIAAVAAVTGMSIAGVGA